MRYTTTHPQVHKFPPDVAEDSRKKNSSYQPLVCINSRVDLSWAHTQQQHSHPPLATIKANSRLKYRRMVNNLALEVALNTFSKRPRRRRRKFFRNMPEERRGFVVVVASRHSYLGISTSAFLECQRAFPKNMKQSCESFYCRNKILSLNFRTYQQLMNAVLSIDVERALANNNCSSFGKS